MSLESLRSLQKRIREATGPDRKLDAAIAKAFGMPHGEKEWIEDRSFCRIDEQAQKFTADPDGLGPCVALQRAVLPGCKWERDRCGSLRIWHPDNGAGPSIVFAPANDCLTFLYAIVGALIAQEEAKENADE